MSFAKVYSRGVLGISAPCIEVEVHLSQGLPSLTIVGLPAAAVRESKDRVRSAIINSGFTFPTKRLTINLAPADLPKDSARLDLAIALGILIASGQISPIESENYEFIGELSLDGQLRSVSSAITIAIACQQSKRALILPEQNAQEASRLNELKIYTASSLKAVCDHFNHGSSMPVYDSNQEEYYSLKSMLDLKDVKGQLRPRRALEIAAAGGHSLLFRGPPGTGKTLLASRLPSILPPLTAQDILEVASIYSVAKQSYTWGMRPFRAPHHSASSIALVGGGSSPQPGEITLAHLGVLFLDELPEFDRKVIEALRQPIEEKQVTISRASRQTTFPAHFQLIAAMNPCPCGYAFHQDARCQCSPETIRRYQSKISGPMLDRIDLHIDVPPLSSHDLQSNAVPESSETVRNRVIAAHTKQLKRQNKQNHALSTSELQTYASLDATGQKILELAQKKLSFSARSYHRILRLARTIADLDGASNINSSHLTEALSYRSPFP